MQLDYFLSVLIFCMLKKPKLPIAKEAFWEGFIPKELRGNLGSGCLAHRDEHMNVYLYV